MSIGEQIHLVIAAILGPMILYALLCAPAEPKSYGADYTVRPERFEASGFEDESFEDETFEEFEDFEDDYIGCGLGPVGCYKSSVKREATERIGEALLGR